MADNDAKPAFPNHDTSSGTSAPPTHSPSQPNTQITANTTSQPAPGDDTALDAKQERDLDAEVTPADSMNMDGANDQKASAATASDSTAQPNGLSNISNMPAVVEPRIPQKKDTSLREFLGKMDDYAPLIPDAVTDYYLTLAGLPPPPETDRRLARLLALATQKFIVDIASDAYQYSRIRSTNTTSNNPLTGLGGAAGFGVGGAGGGEEGAGKGKKDAGKSAPLGGPRAGYGGGGASGGQGRTVLTMEDLGMAVGEYGVNVKRGEFYR